MVIRQRYEGALLWGRLETEGRAPEWLLIEAFRENGDVWRLGLSFREFTATAPPLRPGETADGTWHGFNRYTQPPTSAEVCEFARVSFLSAPTGWPAGVRDDKWRVKKTGGLRSRTWRRVIAADQACAGWES